MGDDPLALVSRDPASLLVAGDRAEELGRDAVARALRAGAVLPPALDGYGDGDGDGDGYGSGSGYGYGYGDGYGYGYGYGYGDGDGDGDGYGDGSGYGDGDGDGDGYGYGSPFCYEVLMGELAIGQPYVFMLGWGWMIVARYAGPHGLFGVLATDVVNICRTGGTAWPDLAAGKGRSGASFKRWPDVTPQGTPFPYAMPILRWEGEVPRG